MSISKVLSAAFFLLTSTILFAQADKVETLLSDSFSAQVVDSNLWTLSGRVVKDGNSVITGDSNAPVSGLKSKSQFALPHIRKGDDYALRLEWSVKPIQLGSISDPFDNCDYKWGSEIRAMGGRYHQPDIQVQVPFVVGLDNNKAYLNTTHSFDLPASRDGWFNFSIDFTAEKVIRFTINGQSCLPKAIDCYKEGPADKIHIRLADYAGTKSSTRFGPVTLSRVQYSDALKWRIDTWSIRSQGDANEACPFLVAAVNPMKKLFREIALFDQPLVPQYETSAAGNEYESFQVAVVPTLQKLTGVRLEMTDLISESGSRIAAKNLSSNPVGYVQTKDAYTSGERVGWNWPDPLMPSAPVDVNAGTVCPIWVNVYVPAGTAPGNYTGIVKVLADNVPAREVLVKLRVYGFDLPKASSLSTAFAFCPQTWVLWHKIDEISKVLNEQQRGRFEHTINIDRKMMDLIPKHKWVEVYDFLLAHRLNPTFYYQPTVGGDEPIWPFVEDWQYLADNGMNNLCIAQASIDWDKAAWWSSPFSGSKDKWTQAFCARVDKYLPLAKKLKWNGMIYVYGFDESDMQKDHDKIHDPAIRDVYGMVAKKYPGLRRASANPINPTHFGYFDVWIPVTYQVDYQATQRRQALGEDVWAYVCCGPGKPMSNFFIDYPGTDHRVLFWELSRAKITGLLYWALNYYMAEINWNKPGPRWPDVPWNGHTFNTTGDGFLIYPGKDMTPLSCVRLENIRDGIEDYDYISLLRDKISKIERTGAPVPADLLARAKQACEVPSDISKSFSEHTLDGSLIQKQRAIVGSCLEELSMY